MKRDRSPFNRGTEPPGLKIVRNDAGDEATILIYDEIGYWGIQAADFIRQLAELTASTINVRINSPGGGVFEGIAIYNAIRQHSAHIIVHVDALAASIASLIAMAGDEVKIAKNAYLMIHEPWTITMGNASQLRRDADLLDKFGDTILGAYVAQSGQDAEEIRQLMRDESWVNADEALELGLVDEVVDTSEVKATFDLSVFQHAPAALAGSGNQQEPTVRSIERALRDAGLSRSAARAAAAAGLQALTGQRDAVDEADIATGRSLLANLTAS